MRYTEVLLIHAEAALQLGRPANATTDLTAVRTRAGLAAAAPTLANIWRERRVELATEHDAFLTSCAKKACCLAPSCQPSPATVKPL